MTALQLLFLAMSAASVLAEPTVYLREQFEDGGESFLFTHCYFEGYKLPITFLYIPDLQKYSCGDE